MSDKPQKQASEKADQSMFGSGVIVISYLLMELLIGDKKHCLPLSAYVVSFGKASHSLAQAKRSMEYYWLLINKDYTISGGWMKALRCTENYELIIMKA